MQGEWINPPDGDTTIVFVHGLLSSGEACWKHENGAFWPALLKNESGFETSGVYLFTYRTGIFSGNYRIGDAVDSLWEFAGLDKIFDGAKKIVFVCHSMGGIVVRRFIVQYRQFLAEKRLSVGLFLVASPSLGSDYANFLSAVTVTMGHTQARALAFSQQNDWLNDLDKDFMNLKSAENTGFTLVGKELIEDRALVPKRVRFLDKIWKKQVVEPFSGARYFGNPYKVPGSDHLSIARPENNKVIQHRLLCRFIEEMPDAPSGDEVGENGAPGSDGVRRSVSVRDSRVGVIGDNATVGEINFNTTTQNRSVNIGGNVDGGVIITGDGNKINR